MAILGQLEAFHIEVHGPSAIVMNAETGAILFEKNAYELCYPASIAKIATAIYALEKNRNFLDSEVIAEQESIGTVKEEEMKRTNYRGPPYRLIVGGTHISIKNGEILPFRALLYGMMLESGNDAANVIAQYTSGNINLFMKDLNCYLVSIGCKNTHFMNPSGLHHPDQKTTAYDMAMMAKQGLKDPLFREIVKTIRYTRPKTNKQDEKVMVQHNRLVKKGFYYYEHAIGIKTGYYSLAGHNLVAAAEYKGRTLIAVILGSKNKDERYEDAIALFKKAFSEPKEKRTIISQGPQKISVPVGDGKRSVGTYTTAGVSIEFYPSEIPKIEALISPYMTPLPIRVGDKVGQILLRDQKGHTIDTADLFAAEEVSNSLLHSISAFMENIPETRNIMLFLIICGCFFTMGYLIFNKR